MAESKNAYEYITYNGGVGLTGSQNAYEYITYNGGAVLTSSKNAYEYITNAVVHVRNPDWKIFVPTLNSTNSDFWQPNGSAYLTSGGASLTPNSQYQAGNVVTKNIYSMKSFEFKITLTSNSSNGNGDGIILGIYYADEENANSIGGTGGNMAWYGGSVPAGVAMFSRKYDNSVILTSRLTHGGTSTDRSPQSGYTLGAGNELTLTAQYVVGTASTYRFRLLGNGLQIFNTTEVVLPSKHVPIRFFIGGTTGYYSSVWAVENVSIYGAQGKKGFGVSRY